MDPPTGPAPGLGHAPSAQHAHPELAEGVADTLATRATAKLNGKDLGEADDAVAVRSVGPEMAD
ncbi:MAG TPA: hypothetical protein VGG91_03150, partial [Myxococcaceae bacterium]